MVRNAVHQAVVWDAPARAPARAPAPAPARAISMPWECACTHHLLLALHRGLRGVLGGSLLDQSGFLRFVVDNVGESRVTISVGFNAVAGGRAAGGGGGRQERDDRDL